MCYDGKNSKKERIIMEKTRWYKDKVFYQIWPRSFKDGNGDGMGDLLGVYEKLDYIKSLGCDGIWFSPLYPSPGVDCGYDISDYYNIAEEFGGMEAFRKVLDSAHERGMKVIMDLVVNHTSTEHEWFKKSRQRIEPYTAFYIWCPQSRAASCQITGTPSSKVRPGYGTRCGRNTICTCFPSSRQT